MDVDEADIAVLNEHLMRSKELFESIDKSLFRISNKTQKASSTIKPILSQVNQLTNDKKEVEKGINLLSEVSSSTEKINNFENILNNPIEVVGFLKYLNVLKQSKELFSTIQPKFKQFKGIIYNFEGLIERSESKVQNYLEVLVNMDTPQLIAQKNDIRMVFDYFENQNDFIMRIFLKARSKKIASQLKPYEQSTKAVVRGANIPYERGSNGITKYTDVFLTEIHDELELLNVCELSPKLLDAITQEPMFKYNEIITRYNQFFDAPSVITENIVLILEILDNLQRFKFELNKFNINNHEFNKSLSIYVYQNSVIFKEFIKSVVNRYNNVSKITENNSQEIVVDIMSKLRKISEFRNSLLELIKNFALGDWVNDQQFISTFSSVILDSNNGKPDSEYLLSSFYSDVIDAIMVNLEIALKNASDPSYKKSTQGFILIKNLFMLDSIIKRSKELFNSLGKLGERRIEKLRTRFLKLFLEDWNHASFIIIRGMTDIATQMAQSQNNTTAGTGGGPVSNLSSKERESVKELFKNFNESFEEALLNYTRYNFGDMGLKNFLGGEVKKLIANTYFKLYDKYGTSDFTKNKSKYVKYDKIQFQKLLDERL
ncbi:EXO70 Exocyst complex protein EXO70 [Candida maltosa Xu316]|uniref:Exocyst complex subunit Exo70 C-terminal domain-containing protein n=1 Tax=Candida maltosa (strain Xu316) TaxID=1245528 RepID=M3J203_CANMX|nr:hypothetical protein G210_3889 [Candida maltosa Xu316]